MQGNQPFQVHAPLELIRLCTRIRNNPSAATVTAYVGTLLAAHPLTLAGRAFQPRPGRPLVKCGSGGTQSFAFPDMHACNGQDCSKHACKVDCTVVVKPTGLYLERGLATTLVT